MDGNLPAQQKADEANATSGEQDQLGLWGWDIDFFSKPWVLPGSLAAVDHDIRCQSQTNAGAIGERIFDRDAYQLASQYLMAGSTITSGEAQMERVVEK